MRPAGRRILSRRELETAWIHTTAEVDDRALVGARTRIWQFAQVRERANVGVECIIGRGVYVDAGVRIGDRVKLQNYCCIYRDAILENGVFVGPHAVLANDRHPRSINSDGSLRGDADWMPGRTVVCEGASIGAHAVILPGVVVGAYALVGAGAVVTSDVNPYAVVAGSPARERGSTCRCARTTTPSASPRHAECGNCRGLR